MKKMLFKILRKNKFIYNFSYKIYEKSYPIYASLISRVSNKYAIERDINRLSKRLKENPIGELHFIDGEAHLQIGEYKFGYFPEPGTILGEINSSEVIFIADIILRLLRKDSVFFDLGANFGYFTIVASSKISDGRIYSFEPVPKTYWQLKKNISLNNISNRVYPLQVAISDKDGFLNITTDKSACNHIVDKSVKNSVKVKTIKLDSFCKQNKIDSIDVIKCDVEGAEYYMIKGGVNILKRCKPVLILEIQTNWLSRFNLTPDMLFKLAKELGYNYKLLIHGKHGKIVESSNYKDISADLSKANDILFYHGDYKKLNLAGI